jgi:glucokinase
MADFMSKRPVLAGDIGGTKTSLALYTHDRSLLRETTYSNHLFTGLQEIIQEFLAPEKLQIECVCLGVAGPVRDNRVQMTNLDWTIDGQKLCSAFGFTSVLLVNDLVATTAGAGALPPESLVPINTGKPDPTGTIAVLAPGTGLGQAFAVTRNDQLLPFPSEGGHSSFAPRNKQQVDLLNFMLNKKEHVSVEQVCSGMAIPDLFAFISTTCPPPEWLTKKLHKDIDHTPKIVQAAVNDVTGGVSCEAAVQTLHLFMDILAAETANLALKTLATGGVYIGGGMPPRMLFFFDKPRFMNIFCRGVFRDLLADIPVYIILDTKTALTGAGELALAL